MQFAISINKESSVYIHGNFKVTSYFRFLLIYSYNFYKK